MEISAPIAPPAGCSEKPLAAKLGYKAGQRAAFIALPPALAALPALVPGKTAAIEWKDAANLQTRRFDVVHAFTARQADLERHLPAIQRAIRRDGAIWISWPKRASKVPTDVTEDKVRAAALKLDLVDVKIAAVDAVWSGLKLVIRKERRTGGGMGNG